MESLDKVCKWGTQAMDSWRHPALHSKGSSTERKQGIQLTRSSFLLDLNCSMRPIQCFAVSALYLKSSTSLSILDHASTMMS